MRTISTRTARLVAASALALGLTMSVSAGPALASYSSWAGSVPDAATSSAEDDATTQGRGYWLGSATQSAEDGAAR